MRAIQSGETCCRARGQWTRRLLLLAVLIASWVTMVLTHELGHILGGWLGGANLLRYDLAPWRLPYSLHAPDPHPWLTLWAGPLFGTIAPCVFALALRAKWVWFIADFCVIANGCYLALGWLDGSPQLDTTRMLASNVPPWTLALFCVTTIALGYFRFRRDCIEWLLPEVPPEQVER